MNSDDSAQPPSGQGPSSPFKSTSGWRRVLAAAGYSWAGLKAAVRHEAAFRQELALGIPLLALAWWLAPGRWQALALTASVVLVWIVELLNSALEALADEISLGHRKRLGRAKDLGSAAVMMALLLAALAWGAVIAGRLLG